MITVEEAKKLHKEGVFVAGMQKQSSFTVTAKVDRFVGENRFLLSKISNLLNSKLQIKNYNSDIIQSITITLLMYKAYNGQGVNWQERKYFKRSEKHFFIDIRISDYDRFCNATREEALKILAQETLRGIEKFLTKVKDFDFPKFYADVKELFEKEFGI